MPLFIYSREYQIQSGLVYVILMLFVVVIIVGSLDIPYTRNLGLKVSIGSFLQG